MSFSRKVKSFCKRNWKIILASLGVLTAFILVFFSKPSKRYLTSLKKLDISKEQKQIARLEGQKDILRSTRESNEEDIQVVEEEIERINKNIKSKRAQVTRMNTKQKLDEFDKLGY